MINLAELQRLPEERGFKSTHDWLIKGHGYSGGAANRRVQAARLLREVPDAAEKVEDGSLNLTTLWTAQKTIQAQQKASGEKVSTEKKREALERINDMTEAKAEQELNILFPDAIPSEEKVSFKRNGGQRITVELTEEEALEIMRARELLSQALPGASHGGLYARLAKEYNDRKDPLRRPITPTPRRATTQKANAACTYEDPLTGRVCGSRFQLEIDHIVPKAIGGTDDPSNLRCLCRKHNQFVAEQAFGREFMERKRQRS